MRASFDVPFSKLGTTDLRVPLSANPRYHYDRQHRVVHVTHDPLPLLAHDAMPRSMRPRGRDQAEPNDNGLPDHIVAFLRERLDADSWRELCEMCGASEEETYDENFEPDPNRPQVIGASDAALSRSQANFVRDMCARLKFAGP